MAITIAYGIQKGGVGKSTSCAITSYLLAQSSKVLAVDFDSQGNLTELLTQQDIYNFTKQTVFEAVKEENAQPYIHPIHDKLDILPAEDFLSGFSRYIFTQYKGEDPNFILRNTLDTIRKQYDYILIDLPPNLGEQTTNGLCASDFVVAMLQAEPFCYSALDRFLEYVEAVKEKKNPNIKASILTSMVQRNRALDITIVERVKKQYGKLVFTPIIKRRSRINEFCVEGITTRTKKDIDALEQYFDFIKELKERVPITETI